MKVVTEEERRAMPVSIARAGHVKMPFVLVCQTFSYACMVYKWYCGVSWVVSGCLEKSVHAKPLEHSYCQNK